MDVIFDPIEKLFFRISGIDPLKGWNWKQNMMALMAINFVWFLLGMFILMNQNWLPLNPDNNPGMSADLAFNTTISFIVNCNLQHYSIRRKRKDSELQEIYLCLKPGNPSASLVPL